MLKIRDIYLARPEMIQLLLQESKVLFPEIRLLSRLTKKNHRNVYAFQVCIPRHVTCIQPYDDVVGIVGVDFNRPWNFHGFRLCMIDQGKWKSPHKYDQNAKGSAS